MQADGEDSGDEEGFHDAPAVLVGGEPPLPLDDRPVCLRCKGPMHYGEWQTVALHSA